MRLADIVMIVIFLALVGGGIGGFMYWRSEEARAEERRYEAAVDALVDRKLGAYGLSAFQADIEPHGQARTEALGVLYEDQMQSDLLNLGFGTVRGDWRNAYADLAEQEGREVERGRLEAEIDERFGAGAYVLMETNYEQFLEDAPRRGAEEYARAQQRVQDFFRALADYHRRHGDYPDGPITVVDGRVVEGAR